MKPVLRLVILLCLTFIGAVNSYFAARAQSPRLRPPTRIPEQFNATAALPELPRVLLNTAYVEPTGRILHVGQGGDLQEAINSAQSGDVITLQPGAVFVGNFELPARSSQPGLTNEWITIRPAVSEYCLPFPENRITPEFSDVLPKIISPNGFAAIRTLPGAHHYRLVGLEISLSENEQYSSGLVLLGDGSAAQNTFDGIPYDLIVDRCYIHGNKNGDIARGVALNSARSSVIDSYISEVHGREFDTQAIGGWNGPGPFKIVNNYLEASGENIMFGGGDPSVFGLIPADIEIRSNHFFKPYSWRVGAPEYEGIDWSVKNLLELKNSQRVLIEGNIFENNWVDSQDGFAVIFKSTNQDGTAPWSVTLDVTFVNNIIRNTDGGINLLGYDEDQPGDYMKRVLIRNNLWENIDGERFGGIPGRFLQLSITPDVIVDHNTVLHSGNVISTYGMPSPNFVYTNNLSAHNEFGVKGDGEGTGNGTLNMFLPNAVFMKNLLAGGPSDVYPPDNFFPASLSEVRFVDPANGNYRLAANSPFKQAGADGKDLGCDFDALTKAIHKVVILRSLPDSDSAPKILCGRAGLAPDLQR
ncbi:MAG: hypothetical protein SF097_01790 [Acidobacteriota bacterium]|nr:hypothetical protein [Acidobacteriota bacterium]